jgi:hypothetical protein
MSRQLTLSAAFSVFAMAAFALSGAQRETEVIDSAAIASPVEISAAQIPLVRALLPVLR